MEKVQNQKLKEEQLLDMKNEQKDNECSICLHQYDFTDKKSIVFHTTQNGMQHKFCLQCLKKMVPINVQLNTLKCPLDNLILTTEELKNLTTQIYPGAHIQVIAPIQSYQAPVDQRNNSRNVNNDDEDEKRLGFCCLIFLIIMVIIVSV
jgi:hypothetical protein